MDSTDASITDVSLIKLLLLLPYTRHWNFYIDILYCSQPTVCSNVKSMSTNNLDGSNVMQHCGLPIG